VYAEDVPYSTRESAGWLVVQVIVAAVVFGVPVEILEMIGFWITATEVVAVLVPFAFVAVKV
jgi:hypothetical protein